MTIRSTPYFGPRTWAALISGKPTISTIYEAGLTGGISDLGLDVWGGEVAPGPNGGKQPCAAAWRSSRACS
jgi:hypothetical protein